MNEKYKVRYEKWDADRLWLNDPFGLFVKLRTEERFEDSWNAALVKLHKALFPRRRKIQYKNLPAESVDNLRAVFTGRAERWLRRKVQLHNCLGRWLDENASLVDLTPLTEYNYIKSSDTSTYSSQGSGKYKYAKQALGEDLILMLRAGFDAEIIEDKTDWGARYYLKANAAEYHLDAVRRLGKMSTLEWAVECWGRGVNPKVYNPWLDDAIFDRSMAIHMGVDNATL